MLYMPRELLPKGFEENGNAPLSLEKGAFLSFDVGSGRWRLQKLRIEP
jgi:hypothetical protein